MSQLLETIRLEDGKFLNLPYHELRMKRAWKELFNLEEHLSLVETLNARESPSKGIFRCRVTYDTSVRSVEFIPHQPRPVSSLRLVEDNRISYSHKFKERSQLENLFHQRSGCDDVLITKNGFVTDTTVANILFRKGNEWFTPESCLLPGTVRQRLIDNGTIKVVAIHTQDLQGFSSFRLINALLQEEGPEIPMTGIVR